MFMLVSMTLTLMQGTFKFGMTVDFWMPYNYAHARFDDHDLDARSQWVGRGKTNQRGMLSTTKKSIRTKLATTVGHFCTRP